MLQEYYNRYWIKAGVKVYLKEDLSKENLRNIHVDYLIKKGVKISGSEGKRHVMVVGVRCHWLSDDGKYQVGRFNVNELIPADVYDEGNNELIKWSEYMSNGQFKG